MPSRPAARRVRLGNRTVLFATVPFYYTDAHGRSPIRAIVSSKPPGEVTVQTVDAILQCRYETNCSLRCLSA